MQDQKNRQAIKDSSSKKILEIKLNRKTGI